MLLERGWWQGLPAYSPAYLKLCIDRKNLGWGWVAHHSKCESVTQNMARELPMKRQCGGSEVSLFSRDVYFCV